MEDGQGTVHITVDIDPCPNIMTTIPVRWNLERHPLKADAVIRGNGPFMMFAKDVLEMSAHPGDKSGTFLRGFLLKLPVVSRQIDFFDITIGLFHARNVMQGQFPG